MENKNHKVDGMLIGKYVQKAIKNLFDQNKIYDSDLIKLQDPLFCKTKFDLNYPMFKKSNDPKQRYYQYQVKEGYWLTNDWYVRHWDYFLKWENSKK